MSPKRCNINIYDKYCTKAQVQTVCDSRCDTSSSELYRTAGVSTWFAQIFINNIRISAQVCSHRGTQYWYTPVKICWVKQLEKLDFYNKYCIIILY